MTKRQLVYGQGLMRLLRQRQYHPLNQHQQVVTLVAALGLWLLLAGAKKEGAL